MFNKDMITKIIDDAIVSIIDSIGHLNVYYEACKIEMVCPTCRVMAKYDFSHINIIRVGKDGFRKTVDTIFYGDYSKEEEAKIVVNTMLVNLV